MLYTTTRPFPPGPDDPLTLELAWVDIADALTMTAPAAGAIPLPTARRVRVELAAMAGPKANYYGADDVRFSQSTILLRPTTAPTRPRFSPGHFQRGISARFLAAGRPGRRAGRHRAEGRRAAVRRAAGRARPSRASAARSRTVWSWVSAAGLATASCSAARRRCATSSARTGRAQVHRARGPHAPLGSSQSAASICFRARLGLGRIVLF